MESEDPNPEDKAEMEVEASESPESGPDPFKKPPVFKPPTVFAKKIRNVQPNQDEAETSLGPEDPQEPVSDQDQAIGPVPPENQSMKVPAGGKQIQNIRSKPVKAPPSGQFPPLPYSEPPWAGVASVPYSFELLKSGSILDTVPLSLQSYFVVGRLPVCDISLEHPSISRYHAVVQHRGDAGQDGAPGEEPGFYVYDLGSTHGTFVNKNKIPPKTYIRLKVGHVLKFGGSTRLFVLQGPESDEEAESELTVTELRERARKQREELERKMVGDGSDDEDDDGDDDEEKKKKNGESVARGRSSSEETGCSWGMGDDEAPDEDENEENPFATEFQEDQEAAYLKDPKKALQGFYDREGEELEFEYEEKGHGTWLCRIRLPVDDAAGRQLVAELTHVGKKKEAAVQCCLEACRMLEARGLLRQEAVSRKRKKKNWEDDDYYDSDDDSFLDRTGTVERKRTERMKKAGKIQEKPETFESLVAKLAEAEKNLADTEKTLSSSNRDGSSPSTEDPLDAFMSSVRSQVALDGVQRKKLHLQAAELKTEVRRLRKLVELTRPTALPSLQSRSDGDSSDPDPPKKFSLPLFGAMKGGSKFKLKTGTLGKLPPKKPELPSELFNMKEPSLGGLDDDDDDEEQEKREGSNRESEDEMKRSSDASRVDSVLPDETKSSEGSDADHHTHDANVRMPKASGTQTSKRDRKEKTKSVPPDGEASDSRGAEAPTLKKRGRKMIGPSRNPSAASTQYPEDDPSYSVWVPPAGQSGDGRTHLNDKYGY